MPIPTPRQYLTNTDTESRRSRLTYKPMVSTFGSRNINTVVTQPDGSRRCSYLNRLELVRVATRLLIRWQL